MTDTPEAQCGYCRKRFRLRPDQMDREVRCPHCKTVVRIHPQTETAQEAARALKADSRSSGRSSRRPSGRSSGRSSSRSSGDRRAPTVSHAGVQSRNLAVVWAILLAVALGAVIVGLVVVFRDYGGTADEDGRSGSSEATAARGGGAAGGLETGPDGMPVSVDAGQAWQPPARAVTADIDRLLRGYADETVTYAVGHVTNNSEAMIPTILIEVGLWLSEDGEKVGDATAVIFNLPPKHTAPYVAECKHKQGVRAKYYMLQTYDTSPTGLPRDLPPLEARNPVPIGDPNTGGTGGLIQAMVTNHGKVPVKDILMMALLLDEKGKIVGAARQRDTQKIEPGETKEVEVEWRHTVDRLVRNVEVWVQPHFYQEK